MNGKSGLDSLFGLWGSGSGGPAKYNPSLWLSADSGTWTDAACSFVAADKSYLSIADASQTGLDPLTDDFAFMGWFKFTTLSTQILVTKLSGSAGYELYVNADGSLTVQWGDGSAAKVFASSAASTVTTATWTFLAVYADRSGNLQVYKGTTSSAPASVITLDISARSGSVNTTEAFQVGAAGATYFVNGVIDSLMFFKKADLSAVASDIITWAYNSGSGRLCSEITTAQKTAWGAVSGWEMGEATGVRADSWGSNHLSQTFSNIIQPTTYGSELLTNGGFETAGTGGADVFGTWAEDATGGAIADEGTDVHGGSHAAKLTNSTGGPYISNTITVSASTNYRLSFWTHGDGSVAGRYGIYNFSTPGWLTAVTSTTVAGTNYTLRSYDFTTPAGCTSIAIYMLAPETAGYALFDDVSLKAVTTAALNNGGFESWTVPSAAENVANGNFTSNINGWTNHATYPWDTCEAASGAMHVACNGDGTPGYCSVYSTAFSVTSGSVYKITYTLTKNSGAALYAMVVGAPQGADLGYTTNHSASGTYTAYFKATGTDATAYLDFWRQNNAAADWTIDSVSIVEVPSNASTWVEDAAGSSLIYREDAAPYSGSHALAMQADASHSDTYAYLPSLMTIGKLYSYSFYAKALSGTPTIRHGEGNTVANYSTISTTYAQYSATTRAIDQGFFIGNSATASNTIYIDSVTLAAAEILAAPGIVRGRSQDSNFATQLNGTSQYYSYTGTAFNPGTGDFSVGCSFYLDGFAPSYTSLFAGLTGQDYWHIIITTSTKDLQVFLKDGTTEVSGIVASPILAGRWHTLVVTFDRDGNCSAYLNGGTPTTFAISTAAQSVDQGNLYVGRYAASAAYYFPGRIDNAFYANRLLTASEITWLHNNGEWRQWSECGVAGTDGANLTASVVKGFWEFDDKLDLGYDSSGNGNDLTPQGTPTQGNGINYLEGAVSYWADRSGKGKHATSPGVANYPGLVNNYVNGRPAIHFDGVDDFLATALANTDAYTVFAVAKAEDSVGVTDRVFAFGSLSGLFVNSTKWSFYGNEADGLVDIGGTTTNWSVLCLSRASNASASGYVDNSAATAINPKDQIAGESAFSVGCENVLVATNPFHGHIAELIVYPRALSAGERTKVTRYLAAKYGITI